MIASALVSKKRSTLATSISLVLFTSSLAHAQQSEPSENDTNFEVIEVTSQKRVQNVMKVPITVGIVSADLLEKSTSISLSDVDKFIPGFEFADGNVTQAGIRMRGVSSPNISVGGDPSSASFFDDVYMPRAAQNVLFSDIERIEVLKGPQGTLFGRNAAMGVVSVIPKSPTDEVEGFAKYSLGTDKLARLEGMANAPLTDKVFIRANALFSRQDGIVKNVSTPEWNEDHKIWDLGEKNHKAARVSFLYEPSSTTDLQVSFDIDRLKQAPPMAVGLSEYAYDDDIFSKYAENDVRNGVESRDMYAMTLKLNHEFDEHWSMKYIASYRDWQTVNREDEDGTADITRYFATSNNEDSNIFYTELQFNYVSDKISAVAGITYSKEDVSQTTELTFTTDTVARLTTDSLNDSISDAVSFEIATALGGSSDDIVQAVYGPGVTFDDLVTSTLSGFGLPADHLWNAEEWASIVNALGFGPAIMTGIGIPDQDFSAEIVALTGDLTYDIVSSAAGVPEIFGPSYSGQFWDESVNNTGDFTNFGIFADIDYAVTENWHIIAGLRYSKDSKDFSWLIPDTSFASERAGVSNLLFAPVDITASDEWSKVTGRFVTNYQIDANNFVFASYSTGYKSGGFDSLAPLDVSGGEEAFLPEDVSNFEIGYKATLWDSLLANISLYQTELDNFQVSVQSRAPDSTAAVSTIINENRQIDGIEFNLVWSVSDDLKLGIITDIRDTTTQRPSFYNSVGELLAPETIKSSADTDYTLTLDWDVGLELGDLNLHVDYVFSENTQAQSAGILPFELEIPAFLADQKLLNARLSFILLDESMEIALWSRNLLNERYVESIRNITYDSLGTAFASINRGREVGMDFKFSF